MKKNTLLTLIISLISFYSHAADRYWIASTSANWNDVSNWSSTSGGAGGASVPTTGDFVFFDANGLGDCNLDIDVAFDGINTTGYTGTIDLLGYNFNPTISGTENCRFQDGVINDTPGTAEIALTTIGYIYFYGTDFGAAIDIVASRIYLDAGTFNSTVELEQNGASNTASDGGCTFNSTLSITNSGAGQLTLSNINPDIYNGELTINNTGTSNIQIARNGIGNEFNDNVFLNSTNGSGIRISSGTGTANLAIGKTISTGVLGFTNGELSFNKFTQLGTSVQSIVLTGDAIFRSENNTIFNADLNVEAPRIIISGTTFNGVTTIEKTGAHTDYSNGLNEFSEDVTIINSGSAPIIFGNSNPDNFYADLTLINNGTDDIHIAYASLGNNINGDLNVTNTGLAENIYLASQATSSLTVSGNLNLLNETTTDYSNIFIGNAGDLSVLGRLDVVQNGTGLNSTIYTAYHSSSQVTIGDVAHFINNGTGTTKRFYMAVSGDIVFDDSLIIENNSTANNNHTYANHSAASSNLYNGSIVVTSTTVNGDGVHFGRNGGLGELASGQTISIGAAGFIAGELYFNSFIQTGATAQSITLNDDARLNLIDSDWGGNISFTAPRITTRNTHYAAPVYFEKTANGDDNSYGGNTFDDNVEIKSTGLNSFTFANNAPDTFASNLTINNEGNGSITIASQTPGNYIGGNVEVNNLGTGAYNCYVTLGESPSSSLTIDGDVNVDNLGDANNVRFLLGSRGEVVLNGNLTIDHSPTGNAGYIYIANSADADVTINGDTHLNLSPSGGSTKRVYIAQSGDITFNGDLTINNESDAPNSEVDICRNKIANTIVNGNIVLTNTSSDGIFFGNNQGTTLLADPYTISIGAGGYSDGKLFLYQFTQDGSTPQSLHLTGTGYLRQDSCNWGGDVNFVAPRQYVRDSRFQGTAYIEKTGLSEDRSYGGNIFELSTTLKNIGDENFIMGYNEPDSCLLDLELYNEGSASLHFATRSMGNYVDGNITAENTAIGAGTSALTLANNEASSLVVNGNITIDNIGSADRVDARLAYSGLLTINGDLNIDHSPTGNEGYIYMANGSLSNVEINGSTEVNIATTGGNIRRAYFGYAGSIQFNGGVTVNNNSNANNNQVYFNHRATSHNSYNGNITLTNTHSAGDGFLFGSDGGSGELAATYTVSIGPGGFVAGDLYFRNFTQIGSTAQTLTGTGTSYFRNYDSNWGGNVTFTAPRMYTNGTRYQGTATLEKTGATDDASPGGNIFELDATLINSGSGYFLMGNGNFDLWQADLTLESQGSDHMYIAHNSAGNIIDGDLTINATSTGATSQNIYVSTSSASTLEIGGNTSINNTANTTTSNIYFGDEGDIELAGNLSIINNAYSTNSDVYIASGTNSQVTINGTTNLQNEKTSGTSKQIFVGYNGDVVLNGELIMHNSADATYSDISLNERGNSLNLYNENIVINSDEAGNEGIYFGRYDGAGTLAAGKTISIGADDFIGQNLLFRNFTQLGGTAQTLEPTSGLTRFETRESIWNGEVTFSSPRIYLNNTTFNANATLEKTGAQNDHSAGGNTFNGVADLITSGSNNFIPSYGTPNDFNDDVYYRDLNTGVILPTYNCESTYAGSIFIEANQETTLGGGSIGRVIFDGVGPQSINVIGATPSPRIRDVQTLNAVDDITVNTPFEIISVLDLDQGNLITTTTNVISMRDNSTVSSVSDNAYVDGPIIKVGNDIFTFPVGKAGKYRPIELVTAPSSGSAQFRAEYFPNDVVDDGISDTPVEPTIHHISDCEYWMLDRLASASSAVVGIYYEDFGAENCSGVEEQADLIVSRWTGSIWQDLGNGGFTGTPEDGWVRSLGAVTDFSPFTLGTISALNPLPVELVNFEAKKQETSTLVQWETASEVNNDFFFVERSSNGIDFEVIAQVDGAGNSNKTIYYDYIDENPHLGMNYYRLKQVDFDGAFEYSKTKSVLFDANVSIKLFPNPIQQGNELMVEADANILNIEIWNEAGKQINVMNIDKNQNRINYATSELATGIYYIKITTENAVEVKKLMVH
ncbi:T9SS type A sorting domain-containing protein [Crocinitomix algicola]|uniref:T9SS type A sorting domain-containing protein n=1 Tax=Crocinitomix algicola TaxID=1740263 RepID=UPI000873379A|nr:T9SS type A sorting domain-containing protein [Crocinitomix algicola]